MIQHENDAQENNQIIHTEISYRAENNETEEIKIQLEEMKVQLQIDTEIVDYDIHPEQE